MNKIIIKNSIKEIKNNFRRFLSLLLISMLGVGFFAGLKASSPDMQKTIDSYFDKEKLFDIKVISTLGLTEDDVRALQKIENVDNVYGSYSEDVFVEINKKDAVVKALELNHEVNKLKLIEGNFPENKNECVVETLMLQNAGIKIGDYIEIKEDLKEDEDSSFYEKKLKVVGTVDSPLYISNDKGTSNLGAGKLEYYIYVSEENINSDIFSEVYVIAKNSAYLDTTQDEYSEYIDTVIANIETIQEERQDIRYNDIIGEANEKLDEAQQEFDEEKAKGEKELGDAEKKIRDGEKELAENEQKFAKEKLNAANSFNDAEIALNDAEAQLNTAKSELASKKIEAESGFLEAEAKKAELEISLDKIVLGLEEINAEYQKVCEALQVQELPDSEKQNLEMTKKVLEAKQAEMGATQNQLIGGIQVIETELANGRAQFAQAENQIISGEAELAQGRAELASKKAEANSEFDKAEKEIAKAKKELVEAREELEDGKREFDEKIAEAEEKLIDAREEINDIENPKWYIFDRSSNNGYDSYIADTENIARLANAFPVIFFVIAILISLTSMSRMVEEQRIELGTLKALGYKNSQIIAKYVVYATVATAIGSLVGMTIGFYSLPLILLKMYQLMYPSVTDLVIEFNVKYAIIGLGLMLLCTLGATIYSALKELSSMPSRLMRPKAPRNGRRVFLEKIPFIWNKLGFTEKVTVRNMFRYKKRFLMTVIGILGCTALILVGFGLKDSISHIMDFQYVDVCNYDSMLTLKDSLLDDEISDVIEEVRKKDAITECVEANIVANEIKGNNKNKTVDVQVITPKIKEELDKVINLNNLETEKKETLNDDTIFITKKAAELIDVKVGDTAVLIDNDNNEFEVKIGAIVENYVYHYAYMSSSLYEKVYGDEYKTNLLLVQTIELDEQEEDKLNEELLKNSKISSLTSTRYMRNMMSKTIASLNNVVYILILSAGLLAFVVLYNLSNVNISERKRELATIKVLGFYDKEVYDYVTKEIIILTAIGIILGLFAGIGLSGFILKTCETEILIFKNVVMPISYVYAAVITVIFTMVVNFMTYFVLKKVDMIESLKSVE